MSRRSTALAAALLFAGALHAQTEEVRTLEIDGGAETIAALRVYRPALQALETK